MSLRMKRQALVLETLAKAHPHICRAILRGADKDLLQCLSECALNIKRGNVFLTPNEKAALVKYRLKVQKLSDKKTPLKEKHKIVQTGGFSAALLAPLLKPIILPLASAAFKAGYNKIKNTPNHKRFLFRSYRPGR